jgi:hypothetical protein
MAFGLSACDAWPRIREGNLGVLRGLRGSIDVKMALKRSLHDLLSSRKPDFKNFVRKLA